MSIFGLLRPGQQFSDVDWHVPRRSPCAAVVRVKTCQILSRIARVITRHLRTSCLLFENGHVECRWAEGGRLCKFGRRRFDGLFVVFWLFVLAMQRAV